MELRLPLEMSPGREAACRAVFGTWVFFSERCTEKLPLRVDFIHRVEFGEVSGHRVLIKRAPGNRGPSERGTTHEATSGMSSAVRAVPPSLSASACTRRSSASRRAASASRSRDEGTPSAFSAFATRSSKMFSRPPQGRAACADRPLANAPIRCVASDSFCCASACVLRCRARPSLTSASNIRPPSSPAFANAPRPASQIFCCAGSLAGFEVSGVSALPAFALSVFFIVVSPGGYRGRRASPRPAASLYDSRQAECRGGCLMWRGGGAVPRAPRSRTLRDIGLLRPANLATHPEVLAFIEREKLYGLGCGYIDMHLLASTLTTPDAELWTLDGRLADLAARFGGIGRAHV